MTIGHLIKITAAKKLLVKISEKSYLALHNRLTNESNKRNYPTDKLAVFMFDDDTETHFMTISLDKYDKQNMRKFEQLLRKDVFVQHRIKPYDFPDSDNAELRHQGILLELISIRLAKPAPQAERAESALLDDVDRMIDARINASQELNAEEEAIDEDVEKQVLENLAKKKPLADAAVTDMIARICEEKKKKQGLISYNTIKAANKLIDDLPGQATRELRKLLRLEDDDMPMAPPVLIRQRRRVRPGFVSQALPEEQLTGVLAEVKKLEDLIAANEQAIGAGTDKSVPTD